MNALYLFLVKVRILHIHSGILLATSLSGARRATINEGSLRVISKCSKNATCAGARRAYGSRIISTSLPLHLDHIHKRGPVHLTALAGNEGENY